MEDEDGFEAMFADYQHPNLKDPSIPLRHKFWKKSIKEFSIYSNIQYS